MLCSSGSKPDILVCFSREKYPLRKLRSQRSQPRHLAFLTGDLHGEVIINAFIHSGALKLQCFQGGVLFLLGNVGRKSPSPGGEGNGTELANKPGLGRQPHPALNCRFSIDRAVS